MASLAKRTRSAFTLLEIVLVLAIIVAVAAMAAPAYQGTLKRERVRKAADSIAADWTRTRARAIETGQTQLWVCTVDTGTFSASGYTGAVASATNADVAQAVSASPSGASQSASGAANPDGSFGQAVPEGVTISDVLVSDGDTIVTMSMTTTSGESGAATVLFYPDGTSSSARITVTGEDESSSMAVVLNGSAGDDPRHASGVQWMMVRDRQTRRDDRRGLTLLEIVLALAICAIAMTLLAQLVGIGNRAAAVARDSAKAQMIAESMMAEVMAGITEAADTSGTYEQDPNWMFEISVTPAPSAPDTINVIRVAVSQQGEVARPLTYVLTQWQAIPPEMEEEETDTTDDGGTAP